MRLIPDPDANGSRILCELGISKEMKSVRIESPVHGLALIEPQVVGLHLGTERRGQFGNHAGNESIFLELLSGPFPVLNGDNLTQDSRN